MVKQRKCAIVTGAGQGIGRGIVIELVKNGFDVAGVDIIYQPDNKEKGLFEVKQQAEKLGGSFLAIGADISDLNSHKKIVEQIVAKFGRINLLVNNAGVAPRQRLDILETTAESYDRVMSINARGPFFLTQQVANFMIQQKQKDQNLMPYIIFISSISAYVSSPSRAEYCLSKAAVSAAATIYADRLAEFGINVYQIRPGIILTDMTAVVKQKYDKLIAEGLVPQKRWGYPEDVGKAVSALVSGGFDYSTGAVIEVSGGMNIHHL
ncbi:MAG TPA: 3-ketoacyl-ACP reductase [bacterium]|nr:3-ketoacyl-ACP reductase [bacterium]